MYFLPITPHLTPKEYEPNNFISNRMARRSHRYDYHMKDLDEIFEAVEKVGFTKDDILGRDRKQPLATVRQIAVYLARPGRTYVQLGKIFDRHHACMVFSFCSIRDRIGYGDHHVTDYMKKMEVAT